MFFRWVSILFETHVAEYNLAKHIGFLVVRFIMVAEVFFALYCGQLDVWIYQFLLCTWWNLILVFSNHDYDEPSFKNDKLYDWAEF